MKIGILGAGLSGISLAFFLQNSENINNIEILEKEQNVGGLCRSFSLNSTYYDIGPHIIFSKDKEILKFMIYLLGDNINKLRRSNKIFYKGKFVKYPFENELSALPEVDKAYCLNSFLNNPYENYKTKNMLQFFLTTFGEGITNSYLRPYNEKIWKFDPAFMDTQMVERIPKPPKEDIIKSAKGISTEGYLHQLYFYYPKNGGIASLVGAFVDRLNEKVNIILNSNIVKIQKTNTKWIVKDSKGYERKYDLIVSTIPLPTLTKAVGDIVADSVRIAIEDLKYNSIVICALNLRNDNLDDNFAIMIPDKEAIPHRISKVNFLIQGSKMKNSSTTLLAEITYKEGDFIDKMSDFDIKFRVLSDLEKLGFIDKKHDCNFSDIKRFKYAYVIYDLNHKKNIKIIKDFYEKELQIILCGRFGEFEYLNMDKVIRRSLEKSNNIKESI